MAALSFFLTRANKVAENTGLPSASEDKPTPAGALQGGSILNRSEKSLTLAVTVPKNRSNYADCAVRDCTSERLLPLYSRMPVPSSNSLGALSNQ